MCEGVKNLDVMLRLTQINVNSAGTIRSHDTEGGSRASILQSRDTKNTLGENQVWMTEDSR